MRCDVLFPALEGWLQLSRMGFIRRLCLSREPDRPTICASSVSAHACQSRAREEEASGWGTRAAGSTIISQRAEFKPFEPVMISDLSSPGVLYPQSTSRLGGPIVRRHNFSIANLKITTRVVWWNTFGIFCLLSAR